MKIAEGCGPQKLGVALRVRKMRAFAIWRYFPFCITTASSR